MPLCQRRVNHRTEQKTHIGFLQYQRRHNLGGVQRLDGVGQYFVAERKHCQKAQLLGTVARLQIGRQPLHVIKLGKQLLNARVQSECLRRWLQPAFGSLEKHKAQLHFSMLQDAADGWLGDIDQPRR